MSKILKLALVNLMPTKIETEKQFMRLLKNSGFNFELDLITTKTYTATHVSQEHLEKFYTYFEKIQHKNYDGIIITGAPVEEMKFEDVKYWRELQDIMDFSKTNSKSTLHICWGAQAGLYHHYGIQKYPLGKKMFGIFPQKIYSSDAKILTGFDDEFFVPHSRHTEILRKDLEKKSLELKIISGSDESGVGMVQSFDGKQIFLTGHSEYDDITLKTEYERDVSKNLPINVPKNYFRDDDPSKEIIVRWRAHANLLFANWLKGIL
ncbi:MAG: homoserine O-succinyltransferase [Fusobacteriaceae bacterium]